MGTEQLPEGGPVPVPPPAEAGGSPAIGATPAAQSVDPVAVAAAAAAAAATAAAVTAPAAPVVDPAVAAAAAAIAALPPAMPAAPAAPVADPVAAEAAAAAIAAAAAAPAAPAADPGAAAAAAAATVAAAAIKAQQPAAVINLVDRPDLEVPEAFGRTVNAAQNIAGGGGGGGGGAGTPPPQPISGAPPPSAPAPELSEAKILERPYKYDPEESRDTTRQTITLWLIGLLCAIVVLAFVALFASGVAVGFTGTTFFDGLKKILDVLVGPVITLLASAVGFYFGSKQGESVDPAKNTGKTPS